MHMSCRSPIVLLELSSCVPAGAGGEVAELAPAGGGSRTLERRLGCRASCWEPPQPDVWANAAGKELPTQWCSGINLPSVMQEWVMTLLFLE